jgi:hypothetical protein
VPDGSDDQVVVAQRHEDLRGAFLGELLQPLLQMLELQRILQADALEEFRREVRDAGELQRLALGEGVADLDGAVVVQADDVPGHGELRRRALAGEEGHGVGNAHVLADAHVAHLHALS